jgi:hypothetical protein
MKKLLIVLLVSFSFSNTAQAVGIDWEGYFRSRGNFHYNLDLSRNSSPEIRGFTDVRFRLNPTFYITDTVRVKSSLNFLDGVLGGAPFRGDSYTNPAQSYNRYVDTAQAEGTVGRPLTTPTQTAYGGTFAAGGSVQSSGVVPITLRRAWLELDIPFGVVKVGRMPNHFGLGIFANAGDDPQQEVGSSRDRIMYETTLGEYYLEAGVGWLVEGLLDSAQDDSLEYLVIAGRKTENQNIGVYLSFNKQNDFIPPASVPTTTLTFAKSNYWAFDFYAEHDFGMFDLGSEIALFTGTFLGKNLLAVNAVAKSNINVDKFSFLIEGGLSTGTSAGDLAAGNLRTFQFSRDYDVAMIAFEEALPGGATVMNSTGTVFATPTAPHTGAISNTFYARLKIGYDVVKWFQAYANLVLPFSAKKGIGSAGRLYGFEYDIITIWPLNNYWSVDLSVAHFLPGSFYDSFSNSQSTVLVRGGVVAKF